MRGPVWSGGHMTMMAMHDHVHVRVRYAHTPWSVSPCVEGSTRCCAVPGAAEAPVVRSHRTLYNGYFSTKCAQSGTTYTRHYQHFIFFRKCSLPFFSCPGRKYHMIDYQHPTLPTLLFHESQPHLRMKLSNHRTTNTQHYQHSASTVGP